MKTLNFQKKRNFYEKTAWANENFVCGVDEVGRGCLAGPVIVAAVILPQNASHKLLKDSKQMTEDERNAAFEWIIQNCYFSTAAINHRTIDNINIYQATLHAMHKSVIQLFSIIPQQIFQKTQFLLIDAMPLQISDSAKPQILETYHFNYGESLSKSIAAASIVAKVTRDRLMNEFDQNFPGFYFSDHKGYATSKHYEALNNNQKSIIHRDSFLKNFEKIKENQQNLF
ncbi:TPA: ribonuclease HII [Candidatus Dependentiae bacterium]|nr:MAG: Ribonuclease HII [candidate division TM6 bacterium GW2011_GWE2_31_21]KKP54122.1 MAG: Ribonuclease HII [candidate division TM6 bacterium GW2011_GWF2_33_332]HBS47843.1 ribonuclease HII [Candidatus Dependentiae bacterium]HBZ73028.1 ribonuclease HII [Candidatus Dependentiae bacterium]